MQFLIVRKADPDSEAGVAPHRELIKAMADHVDVLAAEGRFLAGEGSSPAATAYAFVSDRDAKPSSSTARSPKPGSWWPASASSRPPRSKTPSNG